jgi:hypothetical protein
MDEARQTINLDAMLTTYMGQVAVKNQLGVAQRCDRIMALN